MDIETIRKYIIDSEMDLEELVFDRLELSREDLVSELIAIIKEKQDNFSDLERLEL